MAKNKPSILNSSTERTNSLYSTAVNGLPVETTGAKPTKVSQRLLLEVAQAISNIQGWGSVEIFIQDHKVTQITERNIRKTDPMLLSEDHVS